MLVTKSSRPPEIPVKDAIRAKAEALGFDSVGFARAESGSVARQGLERFMAEGWFGDMDWMVNTADRRADPKALWPEVRTAIVLGMNYGPARDPMAILEEPDLGAVSAYAQTVRDYHDVVKKKLRQLARWIAESQECGVKLFVDTAPLMEKPLAQRAGIGWQGKHTNLVSREHGSWLFLGEVLITLDLEPDPPEPDHCGSCQSCLDVCPTNAFPAPYQLDARRCIAYLTIEHKGHIPVEFREPIGNRVFGCDDCLAVCPWNKFAQRAREVQMQPRVELAAPALADLARLEDTVFREIFAGSPIKRLGRDRMVRNVLIAIGNSGQPSLAVEAERLLPDPSPLVRAMAIWALAELLPLDNFAALAEKHATDEADADVLAEWQAGLASGPVSRNTVTNA